MEHLITECQKGKRGSYRMWSTSKAIVELQTEDIDGLREKVENTFSATSKAILGHQTSCRKKMD